VTSIVRKCTRKLISARQSNQPGPATVSPHAFRRSCATELIRNGANPGHVRDILGHEDFQSLQAYVKLAAVESFIRENAVTGAAFPLENSCQ
jgi:site-specific recombinase XerD